MYRLFRMRRYNPESITDRYDYLFPQAMTTNIIRNENGNVLEPDLVQYDRHLDDSLMHFNRALSSGTSRALSVQIVGKVLVDGMPLLITLHTNLEADPTLSFNGGEPYHIVSAKGDFIPGGQIEGSRILVVFDDHNKQWQLISDNTNSEMTKIVLPVLTEYVYTVQSDHETFFVIPGFNRKTCNLTVNYGQTILRKDIDYIYAYNVDNAIKIIDFELSAGEELFFTITSYITTAKHGHYKYELIDTEYTVYAEHNDMRVFDIPEAARDAHAVVINYGQTILRNNRDYVYNDIHTQITLLNFGLNSDEFLVFRVTAFVEAPGELRPNNWGTTGTYRYKMQVIHGTYTATENNVTNFAVPEFNYKQDDIALVGVERSSGERTNQLYILGVDYAIDEIGHVQLLNTVLSEDDSIFFTILKGAMVDVPNFNVSKSTGQSGQNLRVDFSDTQLCNFFTLLLQLNVDLESNPTLKCIDGPARGIVDCFGDPISGGYEAGSYMWLVYNEEKQLWYSLSHSQVNMADVALSNIAAHGVANFIGQYNTNTSNPVEIAVTHNLGRIPDHISVEPCEPPVDNNGDPCSIGDIWSYADTTKLYVGNTGLAVSKFRWSVS